MTNLSELRKLLAMREELPPPDVRRAWREAAGLTQDEVGRAVGVSGDAVCRWESGERTPRRAQLKKYLEVLGLLGQTLD